MEINTIIALLKIGRIPEDHRAILEKSFDNDKNGRAVIDDILSNWNLPYRFYHGPQHLGEMLVAIDYDYAKGLITLDEYETLTEAAYTHDWIYDPKTKGGANELDSANLYKEKTYDSARKTKVLKIIMATAKHAEADLGDRLVEKFIRYDLANLLSPDVSVILDVETRIFKEFGFVDYSQYRQARYIAISSMRDLIMKLSDGKSAIDQYLSWLKNRKVSIGIYPGSFNPFHVGHLNVLEKAERIFDKVIIAFGDNPDKSSADQEKFRTNRTKLVKTLRNLPSMRHRQIEEFDGLLGNYVSDKIGDMGDYGQVTVIRGIGRPGDLENEKLQQRYHEDIHPWIRFVHIIPDRAVEHVSSSGIRTLEKIGEKESLDAANSYKILN